MPDDSFEYGRHSVQTDAALANQKIDAHVIECARNYKAVENRLGRLELGIICALLGIIGVLYQNYATTHPAVTTVTTSVSTSVPRR